MRRLTVVAAVAALFEAGCIGCGGASDDARLDTLRQRFPSEAPRALGEKSDASFAPREDGFAQVRSVADPDTVQAAETSPVQDGRPTVRLPRDGSGEARFLLEDGFSFRVRELGARGAGVLAGAYATAVVYAREDGAAFWSATESGVEEWILLAPSEALRTVDWEIAGATLRQADGAIDVLDSTGRARLRVSAPESFIEGGEAPHVRLSARGQQLRLTAPPGGWALVDPAWRRVDDLSRARHSHTATPLPDGTVLVVGGFASSVTTPLTSGEIFEPRTETWTDMGRAQVLRANHTATLLPNGKVLVAGGMGTGGAMADCRLFDYTRSTSDPDLWVATGSLTTPRANHTATLLKSGKVLVVGGSSAELYDPASGAWSAAGNLIAARPGAHAAVRLSDGTVLVACGDSLVLEAYDPQSGSWSRKGALTETRVGCTATLLPGGRVLVAGGDARNSYKTAELVDPSTWAVTSAKTLLVARQDHSATLLPNGLLLLVGGNSTSKEAETFDSRTGTWSTAGSLLDFHAFSTSTLLCSGQVLVSAGHFYSAVTQGANRAEVFDPLGAPSWSAAASLSVVRDRPAASLLTDGSVLVTGGLGVSSAEVYESRTDAWTPVGSMGKARYFHTANVLPSGKVLIAGGSSGSGTSGALDSAEIFDPRLGTFTPTAAMAHARVFHAGVATATGEILVIGGQGAIGTALKDTEYYESATGKWTSGKPLALARARHAATWLPSSSSDQVFVTGGVAAGGPLGSCEVLGLRSGVFGFRTCGSMKHARYDHTVTILPDGRPLIVGGYGITGLLAPAEIRAPNGQWVSAGSLTTARALHTATLLPNGKVLVTGGRGAAGPVSSAELYDPATNLWGPAPSLSAARAEHFALLLPNGNVLVGGGENGSTSLASVELFDEGRQALKAAVPQLDGPLAASAPGATLSLGGSLFNGLSEAAGGGTRASPTNQPLVRMQRQEGEEAIYARLASFSETAATAVIPKEAKAGWYQVRVVVNGIPSQSQSTYVAPKSGGRSLGAACALSSDCASGFCRDEVCCNTVCIGACEACSAAAGASFDGKCSVRKAGLLCRPAFASCDVEEKCDGSSGACLSNAVLSSGTVCRPAAGGCDVEEKCDGKRPVCPMDVLKAPTEVCRKAAGPCDVEEACSGTDAACPADVFRPRTLACRPPAGPCDVLEQCPGTGAVCPEDRFKPSTETCRVSAGLCDVAEMCTGAGAECPGDVFKVAGEICRTSSVPCDAVERCTGLGVDCPADSVAAAGVECRAARGPCDVAERCDGATTACPADKLAPAGQACNRIQGPCEEIITCFGTTSECPDRVMKPSGTLCRAAAGGCDVPEACTGSSSACPDDAVQPQGAEGEPVCAPFVCSGKENVCPIFCRGEADCIPGRLCQDGECANTRTINIQSSGCGCGAAAADLLAVPLVWLLAGIGVRRRRL